MSPGFDAEDMRYAVHTEMCTYLLDEDGVCRFILAPKGGDDARSSACVGAQYVACMVDSAPGGLVPELRTSGMALFVKSDEEGRFMLLRTRPITKVESRATKAPPDPPTIRISAQSRPRAEDTVTIARPLFRLSVPDIPPAPKSKRIPPPPLPKKKK